MPGTMRKKMGMGYRDGGSLDMKKMKMVGGGVAEDMKPAAKNLGGVLKMMSPAALLLKNADKFNLPMMAAKVVQRNMKDDD